MTPTEDCRRPARRTLTQEELWTAVDTSPDYLVRLARTGKVTIADNRRTATAGLDINHADLVICYRPIDPDEVTPGKGTG
jgi:hypothetical protein